MEEKRLVINGRLGYLKKISTVVILTLLFLILFVNAQNFSINKSKSNQTVSNQTVEILESNLTQNASNLEIFPIPISPFLPPPILPPPIYEDLVQNSSENLPGFSHNFLTILPIENNSNNDSTEDESFNQNETAAEEPFDNLLNGKIIIELPVEEPANETNSSEPERIERIERIKRIIGTMPLPDLNLQLTYPYKITRGEIAIIDATVTNEGGKVKNLQLKSVLPESIESLSGQEMDCGNLDTGETCIFTLKLQTSSTTALGINEIKVTANYEK